MPEIREPAFNWLKSQGNLSDLQTRLVDLVRDWPDSTSAELAHLLARIDGGAIAEIPVHEALIGLRRLGQIETSGKRICPHMKEESATWQIVA